MFSEWTPVRPSTRGNGPVRVAGGVGSSGKYPSSPPLRTLSIVFELIVQVNWAFQFNSGDSSIEVVLVVGCVALAPRPRRLYLSHSTNPSARTFGDTAQVSLLIVRGSFSVVKSPV